jgi:serine/threonine protein kinase
MEAQFLSRMGNHPNIIKLRGCSHRGSSCFEKGLHDAYFLLLDRLDETRTHRIIEWRQEQDATTSLVTSPRIDDHANIHRYAKKLNLALQLAISVTIASSNRDLKSDNVGLINDGTKLQWFDFGLARELPPSRFDVTSTEQYHEACEILQMSGIGNKTLLCTRGGTWRRVQSASRCVYSLTMVLYEMMSHQKPFCCDRP